MLFFFLPLPWDWIRLWKWIFFPELFHQMRPSNPRTMGTLSNRFLPLFSSSSLLKKISKSNYCKDLKIAFPKSLSCNWQCCTYIQIEMSFFCIISLRSSMTYFLRHRLSCRNQDMRTNVTSCYSTYIRVGNVRCQQGKMTFWRRVIDVEGRSSPRSSLDTPQTSNHFLHLRYLSFFNVFSFNGVSSVSHETRKLAKRDPWRILETTPN